MKTNYDLIIIGAGPAGIAAALSASRSGIDTLIVERYGCVGGGMTSMYIRPFLGSVTNNNIGREIEQSVNSYCNRMSHIEAAKYALTKLLHDSNVNVLLQSSLASVKVENKMIRTIEVTTQSGNIELTAKQFIDASGDGALAAMAGCEIKVGRLSDGLMQPTSIMFTIEGIEPWQQLTCQHEEHYQDLGDGREYLDLCHKACASGELPSTINIVRLYNTGHTGERMVNATQLNKVNPLDPQNLFESEYILREQIHAVVNFLKNNIPGMANIRVNGSSTTLGIRESRRVMGDYVLTEDDLIAGRKFDDAIVHDACFSIDIHNPAGPGQSVDEERCPKIAQPYDIPYRCLTPIGFDNLLVAGRCISGTHEAHSSYRVMRICMAMGDAAGHAAALAINSTNNTREINISDLQKMLNIECKR